MPFGIETYMYGGIGPRATLWLEKLFNTLPPSTGTFQHFTVKDKRDYFYQREARPSAPNRNRPLSTEEAGWLPLLDQ